VGFRFFAGLVLTIGGLGWLGIGILETPHLEGTPASADVSAPSRLTRFMGERNAIGPTTLSESEVARLLAQELPATGEVPLTAVTVRLPGDGRLEVAGRLPLRALLNERPLAGAIHMLPAVLIERPVWIRLRARAHIEPGVTAHRRYLRLDVERFWLGERRLPSLLPRVLFSPTTLRLLHWPLPPPVAEVRIETGRIVITTASSP
jgi:hypothetical protein